MPDEVDSELLRKELLVCLRQPTASLENLLVMLEPFLLHWKALLTRKTREQDINYLTLCRLLGEPDRALRKIARWVEWAEQTTSVYEELQMLLIHRLRHLQYLPGSKNPQMIEYVIALDFKMGLRDLIKVKLRQARHEIDFYKKQSLQYVIPVWDPQPEYFLIRQLNTNQYRFALTRQGLPVRDKARYLRVSRGRLAEEEDEQWQALQKQLDD